MGFGIADLPVIDDLDVPVSAEDYVDQANPAPPAPGIYRLQVVKAGVRSKKDGTMVLVGGKFPVIVLEQAKIVEPVENERQFGLFQDVRTKPSIRKGAGGREVSVSDLQDLLRAYDASVSFEGSEHMNQLLDSYIQGNATFVAEVGWGANDFEYIKSQFEALVGPDGDRSKVEKEVANAIYNKARKRTKDFIVGGVRVTSIVGPSGNTLEARPQINRYYPSGEWKNGEFTPLDYTRKLGPFKK